MEALKKMYMRNRDTFDKESPKILTNNKYYSNPNDLFDKKSFDDNNFYIWYVFPKFNVENCFCFMFIINYLIFQEIQ